MYWNKFPKKEIPTNQLIPSKDICPICHKKFIKTSNVIIINKDLFVHFSKRCTFQYLWKEQQKNPEATKERIERFDFWFRFTDHYEKSAKNIPEQDFNNYKTKFATVFLPTNTRDIKIIVRDRIWNALGKKYAMELQYMHALNKIWDNKKDTYKTNFHKTFIPSVLNHFRIKGYMTKKQWAIVENLVKEDMDETDRQYLYESVARYRGDLDTLPLPDRLRYWQRRKSFLTWFNQKNGIVEIEDEEINPLPTETLE